MAGFTLICFQHLSEPNVATQQWVRFTQLAHQRFVHPGPLVAYSLITKSADYIFSVSLTYYGVGVLPQISPEVLAFKPQSLRGQV